jgi:hypothetical protein
VTLPPRLLALLLVAAPLAAPAAAKEPGRFADDYAGALAAARARKVPIFVDAWAPW